MVAAALNPSFGHFQLVALIVFGAIATALTITFVVVARASRADVPADRVTRTAYRLRRGWLAFLVALLGTGVGISLFSLPYPSGSGATDTEVGVRVTGGQFYWSVTPPSVPVGTRVRFDVTSIDVNHGFGIYNPDGQLVGSVQAMPGYHNKLDLTMSDPGRYTFTCLEYCGLRHHVMNRDFDVTP